MTDDHFDSRYLISADALAQQLDDPALRIFDCTQRLVPDPERYVRAESCKPEFDAAHIPGAGYLDILTELSDTSSQWRYMLPALDDLAAAFARRGVGADTRVVLYDTDGMMWATRVWWMLRAIGFDDAAVLDGGLKHWLAEGYAVSDAPCIYGETQPPSVQARPGLLIDKEAVLSAMNASGVAIVNALTTEQHRGGGIQYGRAGRITGSTGVPARELTDPETGQLIPVPDIRRKFDSAGVDLANPVVCYCGGGIAATLDAFVLTLMGAQDVGVYDASLSEWAQNPSLPMESD
ncbi:MAG: sulfurtransferase [Rhodospirillaceae bacterium]|nr:sulfurtransferase [Rhodospirillaceae bacterium]